MHQVGIGWNNRGSQIFTYPAHTIEEALELLTGVAAGERDLDGTYPSDSVFGRAAQRLEEMAQAVAEWSEEEEKPSGHIITEP
jgi:hypothetical protein